MTLIYNATFDKNTRKLSFEDRAGNEIYSFIVPERAPTVDDITKPLTFKATQDDSTVKLVQKGRPTGNFLMSFNGGKSWEEYPIGTVITLYTGDEVSFRAEENRTSAQGYQNYFYFEMTGKIEAWHNVMSMTNADFPVQEFSIHFAFFNLFKDCTSLTKAPILPATTLTPQCYRDMFNGCTSLTEAPELPATTLTTHCYAGMFNGCTSLVNAPVLPVTTLAEYCYFWMFSNCTSLVKAPELRATTLAEGCYTSMFYGCSSLNEVHCQMPSTISEEDIPTYTGDGSNASMEQWLKGVSSTGTFYTNEDANWPSGESGIPTGWNRVPAVDDITKPLTFKATQDGSTVALTKKGSPTGDFQTSTDGGNTWTDYTLGTSIALNTGDEVSFRTSADRTSEQNSLNYFGFQMTGKIWARHNVMSMYRTNDFATYESVVDYAFKSMFLNCTSLTKAPALPATTLAKGCYNSMFFGCASLTKAPVLPATTLAADCYNSMFRSCASLTKAPVLPATTLAGTCYSSMFCGCTSLTKAPALPATTLAKGCYNNMFNGCTSLTEAPELPATSLAETCYYNMFNGCTSLTEAPELPATTLTLQCYNQMFFGCTSLTKSPVLPTTTLDQYCYSNMFDGCSSLNEVRCKMPSSYSSSQISSYASNWLSGVSATGTFYTNADANWPSGASGIPTGWRRVNEEAKDDVTKPLTFRATQNGSTVKLTKFGSPVGDFQTSTDGGSTWTDYTLDSAIALNTGDEVSFRAKADRTSAQSIHDKFSFTMTGKIEAWHNVMSLYRTNDFATYESVVEGAFNFMFSGCTSLTKAPVLPATTLAGSCYERMFDGCTSLTEAPALPATTLIVNCYIHMFSGCTSLAKAPELPATTLFDNCYWDMFSGCTSLTEAPALPATTLFSSCYRDMFDGCTSLVNAPALPATTLARYCYESMFNGCTSLTKAPELPANKLARYCYQYMFKGCTSLKEAPELPATTIADGCYLGMFQGCTSLTKAPALPTTYILYESCYCGMFKGCTSLVNAPALPANSLAQSCYKTMFEGCTSLVKAPALPVTTRSIGCYIGMFNGCSRLNEVRCQMSSEIRAENVPKFTGDDSNPPAWLSGVSSTGKFYTNADANWPSGASGIPTGWTRVNT